MFSQFFSKKKVASDQSNKENNEQNFLNQSQQQQKSEESTIDKKDNSNLIIPNIPKGHEKYSEKDKDKCPFFQFQKQKQIQSSDSSNNNLDSSVQMENSEIGQENFSKEKKVKKPKGGCPFMPSEKKRNPQLGPLTEGWNIEFMSIHGYLLECQGFLHFNWDKKKNKKLKREIFDAYPIYLKHTLFHNDDENMIKVRKLEVSQRFFVYEKFRERGNKLFNQGEYEDSVLLYERALSIFKWLELKPDFDKDSDEEIGKKKFNKNSNGLSNGKSNGEKNLVAANDGDQLRQRQVLKDCQNVQQQMQTMQEQVQQDANGNLIEEDKKEGNDDKELDEAGQQSGEQSDQATDGDRELSEKQEISDNENEIKEEEEKNIEEDQEVKEDDEEETKIPMSKEEEIQLQKEKKQQKLLEKKLEQDDKEFQKKYRKLMVTYDDDNVILHDGEELTESNDIDMRQSMLISIYLNLAIAYMKMLHFRQAMQCLNDATKITEKSSQIMYRKSQCVAYNKCSTLKELIKAKQDIELAIEMKKYEKVFQSEPGILKILNLANHEEAYIQQAHYVVQRIEEKKKWELEALQAVLEREKELEEIEAEMIADGRIPQDDSNEQQQESHISVHEEDMERQVMQIMHQKYYKIIEFYQEMKKSEQVKAAKQELQRFSNVLSEMEFYYNIDFLKWQENDLIVEANKDYGVDFSNEKVQKRLKRLLQENAREIYEQGNFNIDLFEYALKEYFKKRDLKERRAKEKLKNQEEIAQQGEKKSLMRKITSNVFSLEFGLQLVIVVVLILLFFTLNKNIKYFK